ncbi:MAG TPA: alpha/beta hydrolase [Turneriella sp.]|nr:alpha/beta hydrolase [Turneriella sp.]
MERHFFKFQNLSLSYLEAGQTHSKKVLIAHANGYAAGMYAYLIDALKTRYHVCALDFSGHGESQSTLEFNSWDFFRDQIFALMNHKEWHTCVGVGHSLGGGSLIRAAIQDSSRFEKIIAFDPVVLSHLAIFYIYLFGNSMARAALARRAVFKSKEQAYKIFDRHPANKSWQRESVRAYIDYCIRETANGAELNCSPAVESRIFSLKECAHLSKLKNITAEIHLILPPQSHVCPPRAGRHITSGNLYSTVERVANSGHLLPFENHAFVVSTVNSFLVSKSTVTPSLF